MDQTEPEAIGLPVKVIKAEAWSECIDREQTICRNAVDNANRRQDNTSSDITVNVVKTEPPYNADNTVHTEGNTGINMIKTDAGVKAELADYQELRSEGLETRADQPVPVTLFRSFDVSHSDPQRKNNWQEIGMYLSDLALQVDQGLITRSTDLDHLGKKLYSCSTCSYNTVYKKCLENHERAHTDEKPYKCLRCSYSAARKEILTRHELTHHIEKPYKCSKCPYSDVQEERLKRHERTHDEKPYKCSKCPYSAQWKGMLEKHEWIHTDEKPYKCTMCSYSAIQRSTVRRHERTHAPGRRRGVAGRPRSAAAAGNCSVFSYSAAREEYLKAQQNV